MTFAEDIDEIISEVGGDVDDSTLQAKMFGFYKAGARRVPAFIRERNFVDVNEHTLTDASNTIALSNFPGFIREKEVWFKESSQGDVHILVYKVPALQYFHKIITPNYVRKPFYYHIYKQTLQFDSKAPAGLVIGMEYVREISSLEITDTCNWNEQIREALKHFCKMVYFSDYEEDQSKSRENERRGKDIIAALEEAYEIDDASAYVDEKY